jgi:hypothetical protein
LSSKNGEVLRGALSVALLAIAKKQGGKKVKKKLRPQPCYCPACGDGTLIRVRQLPKTGKRLAELICLVCWLRRGAYVRLALVKGAGAIKLRPQRKGGRKRG